MIQEPRNLESRIEGLIASWNVNCPYTISLKLVLDEWNDSQHYDDKEETKRRLCFTTPMKNKSQVRFSYQTNSDGLPPTNLRGRCRPFLAPKTLSFQSPHRDAAYKDIQRISPYSPIVETNSYEQTVASSITEKTFPEKTAPSIEIASQSLKPIPTYVQLNEGFLKTSACSKSIADSSFVTGYTTFSTNQLELAKITPPKACLRKANSNEKVILSINKAFTLFWLNIFNFLCIIKLSCIELVEIIKMVEVRGKALNFRNFYQCLLVTIPNS